MALKPLLSSGVLADPLILWQLLRRAALFWLPLRHLPHEAEEALPVSLSLESHLPALERFCRSHGDSRANLAHTGEELRDK